MYNFLRKTWYFTDIPCRVFMTLVFGRILYLGSLAFFPPDTHIFFVWFNTILGSLIILDAQLTEIEKSWRKFKE